MSNKKHLIGTQIFSGLALYFLFLVSSSAASLPPLLTTDGAYTPIPGTEASPYRATLLRYLNKINTSNTNSAASNASDSITVAPQIVGGQNASAADYPWIAAILISAIPNARDAFFCGGTLVEPDLVVTAAHCMADIDSSEQVQVAIGVTDLRKLKVADRHSVAAYVVNPAYNPNTVDSDIALIRLTQPVSNATLPPITASLMTTVSDGQSVRVIGYGMINESTGELPKVLQTAVMPYVDHARCDQAISQYVDPGTFQPYHITNTQICAGDGQGRTDSCFGDSGGPLVATINGQPYLTGIVSWGLGCARYGSYGVYSEVGDFTDWIAAALDILYLDSKYFFGYVGENEIAPQFTKHIYNYTSSAVSLGSLALANAATGISLPAASDNCSNQTLAANSGCEFAIQIDANTTPLGLQSFTVSDSAHAQLSLDVLGFTLSAAPSAASTLDTNGLTWYSGGLNGSETWQSVSSANSTNGNAMKSADIPQSSVTALTTIIEGPGIFSFDWKVNSDTRSVGLVQVDENIVGGYAFSTIWQREAFAISEGPHRVTWNFQTSSSSTNGGNIWLDNVTMERNAWLTNKATLNSPSPLGSGASLVWILLLPLLLWRVVKRHRRALRS